MSVYASTASLARELRDSADWWDDDASGLLNAAADKLDQLTAVIVELCDEISGQDRKHVGDLAPVSVLARVAYQAYCEALRQHPDVSLHLNLVTWEDLPEPDRQCFKSAAWVVREGVLLSLEPAPSEIPRDDSTGQVPTTRTTPEPPEDEPMSIADAVECICPPHGMQERPDIDNACPIHGINVAFVMCGHGYGWNGKGCYACEDETDGDALSAPVTADEWIPVSATRARDLTIGDRIVIPDATTSTAEAVVVDIWKDGETYRIVTTVHPIARLGHEIVERCPTVAEFCAEIVESGAWGDHVPEPEDTEDGR